MFNGFRGTAGGAVQTAYTDQPGQGVPGELVFASENYLADSYLIGETQGIAAGLGCVLTYPSTQDIGDLQQPDQYAYLPTSGSTAADLKGVLLFDETMQSDANGNPGYNKGRVGRFLRPARVGGRVYVSAVEAIDPATATVNWVIVGGTDNKYVAGQFAPAALAGTAAAGTSVAISTAKWRMKAAAGGLSFIEFGASA